MSTNLRRSSLFNRRFALTRKAAIGGLPGRTLTRQDEEGFDDLEEYFETSPNPNRSIGKGNNQIVKGKVWQDTSASEDEDSLENLKLTTTNNAVEEDHSKDYSPIRETIPMNEDYSPDTFIMNMDNNYNEDYSREEEFEGITEKNFQDHVESEADDDNSSTSNSNSSSTDNTETNTEANRNQNEKDYNNQTSKKSSDTSLRKFSSSKQDNDNPSVMANSKGEKEEGEEEESSLKGGRKNLPAFNVNKEKFESENGRLLVSSSSATSRPPKLVESFQVQRKESSQVKRKEPLPLPLPIANVKDMNDNGRRSKRNRIPPLAFWRNEKVVYGRRQSSRMPVIVDVLRTNAENSPTKQPLPVKRSRSTTMAIKKTRETLKVSGFKPKLQVNAKVMDYDTHRETERLLALGPDQIRTKAVPGEDFSIQTIFTEGSFLSSGVLEFPPNSSKPARNSSKHALMFYIIEGIVEVTIHGTGFIVGTGCQFIVPRGNQYSIRAAWNQTSRIFFCHCKDTAADQ